MTLLLLACAPEPEIVDRPVQTYGDDTGTAAWSGPCPEYTVQIGDLCVDAYEAFVLDGIAVSLPGADPTTFVTWDDARSACAAAGKRLCTTAEWQTACAWGGGTYPWGEEPAPHEVCAIPDPEGNQRYDEVQPAGSLPDCRNPNGVFDQVGNVWEWVDEAGEPYKVGGAYYTGTANAVCASPPVYHDGDGTIGLRCCVDARE
ncbi:MAG: formylglycine-generating enzyme family protein [Myxococcota bacterium]